MLGFVTHYFAAKQNDWYDFKKLEEMDKEWSQQISCQCCFANSRMGEKQQERHK